MQEWQTHLLEEARNYKVITFNVFDTLLFRNVSTPRDVFGLVGGRKFRFSRILAETIARYKNGNGEITLADIYHFLPARQSDAELEMEERLSFPNNAILEIYKSLKDQGKKIYCILDTYLPTLFVERLLLKSGIRPDGLFLSSEYRLFKSTGDLYRKFLDVTQYKAREVIHVGNDYISDGEGASKAGINYFIIPSKVNMLLYSSTNQRDVVLHNMINNGLQKIENRLERIGYEVLGPLLVGYCQWIHGQRDLYKFDKLFFLARDMKLPLHIYRVLYGTEGTDYLYSSRESLYKPNEEALGLYLKQIGFSGNIAVVDTGWHGTSQPLLEYYARKSGLICEVGGLYLGKHYGYRYIMRSKNSASCLRKGRYATSRISVNEAFVEALFCAYEPKTIAYNIVDGIGTPIRRDDKKNPGNIQIIQRGAIRFANECDKSSFIDVDQAFRAFLRLAEDPFPEDIDELCDTEFDDHEKASIVCMKDRSFYLHHPMSWMKDLNASAWKGAMFHKTFSYVKPAYFLGLLFYSILIPLKERINYKGKVLY